MNKEVLGLVAVLAAGAVVIPLVALSGRAIAQADGSAVRDKAAVCASCHGANGIAPADNFPNLAGQGRAYLVKQLRAFRDGTRKDPLMSPMAKQLSDSDIDGLAAYFSALKAASPPAAGASISTQTAAQPTELPHAPIIQSPAFVVPRPHPTRQHWADMLPAGEGRSIIVQKCQMCHDLQRTLAFVRPKEQWQNVVEAMMRRGSPVTPAEKPVVVNYLTKNFGPTSPPIGGRKEVGRTFCTPAQWPKGSKEFRRNWKGSYNIWVSNQQGASIDIVDPVTNKIVSRIPCVSAPDRAEFSRDASTAYVPDRVEHNVTVIDARTGAIRAKVPLIDRPNVSVLTRDYKRLYIGIWPVRRNEDKRGYIQVMDTKTLKIVKTIETRGGIHDLWMSPDGKLLLAMSPEGRFMDLYDTRNDQKIWTCCHEAEIGTMNMEAGPDGSTRRIFFSYGGYPGIVVIDARTGKELMRVPHPVDTTGPYKGIPHSSGNSKGFGFHGGEISPDGKTYWVMQGSWVYKYELPSFKPLGDVRLALIDQAGESFRPAVEGSWLTISPDGSKVYAVRPGRDLLSVIDAKTMKEEALIPTGAYPLHISIWPRGTP